MEPKLLRKIILEELKKVLKEQDSGKKFTVDKSKVPITGTGYRCSQATEIQKAIREKIAPLGNDKISKKILARLKDGKIGPTTTTLINLIAGTAYTLDNASYQKICSESSNIVDKINKASPADAKAAANTVKAAVEAAGPAAVAQVNQQAVEDNKDANPMGERPPVPSSVDLGSPQKLPGSRTLPTDPNAARDTGQKKEEEPIVDPIKDTTTKEEKEFDEKKQAILAVWDKIPQSEKNPIRKNDLSFTNIDYVRKLYDTLVQRGIIIKPTANESLRKSFKRFLKDL